jgi:type II secretory pathway pseudopilin PulG
MPKNVPSYQRAYVILKTMKGGLKLKARGFTVTETLIVLAVTGGLFLAVAASLTGRQSRTQFEQSINEVRSQIQQTINEVGAGFYPNVANFTCTAGGTGPVFAAGTTEQGENAGCTFLGKAIQFRVGTSDPEIMKIYSLAGLQRTSAGDEPITYGNSTNGARARVVNGAGFNATETKPLLYGLNTIAVGGSNIGTVAFFKKLSSNASTIVSGAQQVNFIPINNSPLGSTEANGITRINSSLGSSTVNPAAGYSLCFRSGSSNQSGLITIGGNSRQLSVTLTVKGNRTCS